MSRYRGPRLRVTRRLGDLPGLTRKSARKAYPPGQHGQARKKKSEYALRLEEKQKLRYNYGLTERQLRNYVQKARRKTGSTGQVLLQLMEMRLDNTVFRLGLAPTIPAARQLVNHGHITINGKVLDIASYQVRTGDEIGVRDRDASRKLVEENLQYPGLSNIPAHLDFNKNKLVCKVTGVIDREWVALQINELMVVEYYSRLV
ncbi:30S ribosomal protein S4 [filamentous cyanobacterium LEGE 11480]|uniref:Small ribosomal subunit protein uS4 n=1 Tax=Romeriopsis navalis LEGE 11480 TaxID=2777977 RepID=A0A928VPS6_9CYAN|nr:30S ribosomal protein S4 [Romeriopsis navalis]MBE9030292.1 30S ribosomal protein S4 [Romeriopsis navalis LEGE 11480]